GLIKTFNIKNHSFICKLVDFHQFKHLDFEAVRNPFFVKQPIKRADKSRQNTDKKPKAFQLPTDKKSVITRLLRFYHPIYQPIAIQLPTVLQKADIL
ncbi:MAG TPA: hypothetical protein H9979_10480, partial [Candidatus Megamonas gallistercoris]|nr:hypothetical protein [Candidatus Megamonas gallistercoris]